MGVIIWLSKSASTPNNWHFFRLTALKIRAMLTQFLVEFMQAQYQEILHRLDRIGTQVGSLSDRVEQLEHRTFNFSILAHNMKKPHVLTVVATIIFALMAYFGFSPNLAVAGDISEAAKQAADAIATRNWILGINGLVAFGALVWDYIKGNGEAGGSR